MSFRVLRKAYGCHEFLLYPGDELGEQSTLPSNALVLVNDSAVETMSACKVG